MALVFLLTQLGCTTEEKSALTGVLIGTTAGAIIGHQSGETATGALIGAAVGLVTGYLYGKMRTRTVAEGDTIVIIKEVDCPKCRTVLVLPPEAVPGNKIKCGSCQTGFVLK